MDWLASSFMTTHFIAGAALLFLLVFIFQVNKLYRSFLVKEKFDDLYMLITGCDTGFGHRCAIKLDKLGCHVFAACLSQEKVQELSSLCSKRLVAFQMNVTDAAAVEKALRLIKVHLGEQKNLWALINNAGIVGSFGAVEWMKKSNYQATINVNLLGTALVTNTFLPLIRKSRGRIVNMASTVGRYATIPAPYSVSKFCVEAYTDLLRREVAPTGVTVHTIEPGGYMTNITNAEIHSRSMDEMYSQLRPELRQFYGEKFKTKLLNLVRLFCCALAARDLDEVVDTYIHAATARFPKTRYVVGLNGNFVFRPLWTLPTWISDLLVILFYPKPTGCRMIG
ncbi:unnamed protein product [Lymnaea stagnalis]|uniref:Uncharacterized protein n=1 Tax=Lymnaea stagnalis TaxID=6523 RepID=A0AAV2I9L2_LYMST